MEFPDFNNFHRLPIIDCHVHFGEFGLTKPEISLESLRSQEEFILNVLQKGMLKGMYLTGRYAGLYIKAKYPDLFYAGGFAPWSGQTDILSRIDWARHIDALVEDGFDGIGEMGAKPCLRDKHKPLDSEYYRGFWENCELRDLPVLCHVADPEEFWDESKAPEWAKKEGWVYYKGDYTGKEELYREIENVLDRYSRLKIVLCHFYFVSADIDRAANFLGKYKNTNFDLSLGIELMYNISRLRDEWRRFFIKYQDRILFGTDIATWQTVPEALSRIWLLRNFLESNEEFYTPSTADSLLTRYEEPFIGLNLPENTLRKIYFENFQRIWGERKSEVSIEAAAKRCEEISDKVIAEALRNLLRSRS